MSDKYVRFNVIWINTQTMFTVVFCGFFFIVFCKYDWILLLFRYMTTECQVNKNREFSTPASLQVQPRFQSYQNCYRIFWCVRRRRYYWKNITEMVFTLQELRPDELTAFRSAWSVQWGAIDWAHPWGYTLGNWRNR